MLRIGRVNSRAIDGPVKLSNDNRKMLSDIQGKYEAWFKVWREVYVPKLMLKKNEFKNDRDLKPSDLVYFKKREGELSGSWMIGKIEQVIRGRDGIIRRAIVMYKNAAGNILCFTERSVRTLIRLYSVDDPDIYADLGELQKRVDELQDLFNQYGDEDVRPRELHVSSLIESQRDVLPCSCCCIAHCKVNFRNYSGSKRYNIPISSGNVIALDVFGLEDQECGTYDRTEVETVDEEDTLFSMITSLNLNLE